MWTSGQLSNIDLDSLGYRDFSYSRKPLSLKEEEHWETSSYTGMRFGGEMYDNKNPLPEAVYTLGSALGLTNCGYSFYKMQTGDIIPEHVDHFSVYTEIFQVPLERIYRAIIFLEDWKSGHYFEIDKVPFVNWKAGDFVIWTHEVPHFAANIGEEDRYTLQITGTKTWINN